MQIWKNGFVAFPFCGAVDVSYCWMRAAPHAQLLGGNTPPLRIRSKIDWLSFRMKQTIQRLDVDP